MARWQAAASLAGDGSAGGDSAAGGGLATAALRSRFGGWRLGGRRLGGGGGLATAAPRSQLGVYLSFSLSFSLSRGLSVLIRRHIQDLRGQCFLIFDSFLFFGIYNKSVSLSHSLSELIGEQLHHAPF